MRRNPLKQMEVDSVYCFDILLKFTQQINDEKYINNNHIDSFIVLDAYAYYRTTINNHDKNYYQKKYSHTIRDDNTWIGITAITKSKGYSYKYILASCSKQDIIVCCDCSNALNKLDTMFDRIVHWQVFR